jgi:hypothetical protein
MKVEFREFNPFDLWIWLEFETIPSNMEQQYVEELINSWFYLGKLGAFNAENLQVQDTGVEVSYLDYNMSEVDYLGTWGRCWFDLGTSDLIALDILINGFYQLSKDYVQIKSLIIGGENEDWPVNPKEEQLITRNF